MDSTSVQVWEHAEYALAYPRGLRSAYLMSSWSEIDARCDAFKAMRGTVERDLATLAAADWELEEHEVVCPIDVVMRRYGRSLGHLSGGSVDPIDCLAGVLTLGLMFLFVDCVEPQEFRIRLRRPASSGGVPGPTCGSLSHQLRGDPIASSDVHAQAA